MNMCRDVFDGFFYLNTAVSYTYESRMKFKHGLFVYASHDDNVFSYRDFMLFNILYGEGCIRVFSFHTCRYLTQILSFLVSLYKIFLLYYLRLRLCRRRHMVRVGTRIFRNRGKFIIHPRRQELKTYSRYLGSTYKSNARVYRAYLRNRVGMFFLFCVSVKSAFTEYVADTQPLYLGWLNTRSSTLLRKKDRRRHV